MIYLFIYEPTEATETYCENGSDISNNIDWNEIKYNLGMTFAWPIKFQF